MNFESFRWSLPDQETALDWCRKRNKHGICCTLDILGEDVRSPKAAGIAIDAIISCAQEISKQDLDATLAVKLTSLGALFDKELVKKNIQQIYHETERLGVNIELDMEGTPLVEYTLQTALDLAERGYYVTLALQAYLDRTIDYIKTVIDKEISVRLVKGAYMGDTTDFEKIQDMFKSCFRLLLDSDRYFSVGTHDPELFEWVKSQARENEQKDLFEFGFLKGLADETKLELVSDGWQVSEYVPFGKDSKAYVKRRLRYLEGLHRLGRSPLL
jgi:proline dehydrogenase